MQFVRIRELVAKHPRLAYFGVCFFVPFIGVGSVATGLLAWDDLEKPYSDVPIMALDWCKAFLGSGFHFGSIGIALGAVAFGIWKLIKLAFRR